MEGREGEGKRWERENEKMRELGEKYDRNVSISDFFKYENRERTEKKKTSQVSEKKRT